MQVGDLIKCPALRYGIIIETGVYVGRKDIKVLWSDGDIWTEQSAKMECISESR